MEHKELLNCSSNDIVLLVSGCISPPNQKYLVLQNPEIRLTQYIDSLNYYIENSPFFYIVFCENSNFYYCGMEAIMLRAKKKGKHLEWLSFQGDYKSVSMYGKGYGEDELVSYAMAHSKLLAKAKSFCKVTGRLIVINSTVLMANLKIGTNYFFRDIYSPYTKGVDTRFYLCDKQFFVNTLMNCYSKECVSSCIPLEEVYYKLLNGNYCCMQAYPQIWGTSAGNGRNYSTESYFQIMLFGFFCKIQLYNVFFPMLNFGVRMKRKIKRIFGQKETII